MQSECHVVAVAALATAVRLVAGLAIIAAGVKLLYLLSIPSISL